MAKVSKKELAERKLVFKALSAMGKMAEAKWPNSSLWEFGRGILENIMLVVPLAKNGHGEPEAITNGLACYFQVNVRSAQRLYALYYTDQERADMRGE